MDTRIVNEDGYFVFQQDEDPPHWKLTMQAYLNDNLQGRQKWRAGDGDIVEIATMFT